MIIQSLLLLDVGKQSVGSSFGHFSNIFLSEIIATGLQGGDECQWYCLSFVLDSTLGTLVNLSLLNLVENFIRKRPYLDYLEFGEYGNPPSLTRWTAQIVVWLILVVIGKLACITILLMFSKKLDYVISYLFQSLKQRPQAELIIVMVLIPAVLNVISFWITDTFLKQRNVHDQYVHEQISTDDLDEELLNSPVKTLDRKSSTVSNKSNNSNNSNKSNNGSNNNGNNTSSRSEDDNKSTHNRSQLSSSSTISAYKKRINNSNTNSHSNHTNGDSNTNNTGNISSNNNNINNSNNSHGNNDIDNNDPSHSLSSDPLNGSIDVIYNKSTKTPNILSDLSSRITGKIMGVPNKGLLKKSSSFDNSLENIENTF